MNHKYIRAGFFLMALMLGLFIFTDYGIPLDEPAQRLIGITNLNYVANIFNIQTVLENSHLATFAKQSLIELEDRHYGVIFELPAAFMEVFFNPPDDRLIYFSRHLLNYIYFLFGVAALYGLANLRYKNSYVSLFACITLLLSPRIFADAFYNGKDIVFLTAFALASLSMVWYLINPTWKRCLLHALATAIAIDTRLIAIAIPLITFIFLLIRYIEDKLTLRQLARESLLYIVISVLFIIILWPYLWSNPLGNLLEAFEYISRHPHSAALIFQGKEVLTTELPWYYLLTWIAISTPILYLFIFFVGLIISLKKIFRSKFQVFQNQNRFMDIVFLGLFFGPIAVISISHTSIYNGWRHLYFVYPFFILISLNGLVGIWRFASTYKYGRQLTTGIFLINFSFISFWMHSNHPLQNLYFNTFAGKEWVNSYEVDYWGLANRMALDKVLKSDNRENLLIWPGSDSKFKSGEPTVFSDQLMLESLKVRAKVSSPENIEEAQYVIASNYGNFSPKYLARHGIFQNHDVVSVDKTPIISIFKLIQFDELPKPIINQRISFAQDGPGIYYLYGNKKTPPINWEQWDSDSWQIPESWGTWSKGTTSTLRLPVPEGQVKSISMRLRPFINTKHESQLIDIFINGKKTSSAFLNSASGADVIVELMKELDIKNEIEIQFKGLKPESPKRLGISNDDRQIAVGIESIQFN